MKRVPRIFLDTNIWFDNNNLELKFGQTNMNRPDFLMFNKQAFDRYLTWC